MGFEIHVNIDCLDPVALGDFWAAALGYQPSGELGPFRALADPAGVGPKVVLQRVADPTPGKNRLHLDLYTTSPALIPVEVARLCALGATEVPNGRVQLGSEVWQVLADPEGNVFCVCAHEAHPQRASTPGRRHPAQ